MIVASSVVTIGWLQVCITNKILSWASLATIRSPVACQLISTLSIPHTLPLSLLQWTIIHWFTSVFTLVTLMRRPPRRRDCRAAVWLNFNCVEAVLIHVLDTYFVGFKTILLNYSLQAYTYATFLSIWCLQGLIYWTVYSLHSFPTTSKFKMLFTD